jgi:hypothetical protein
LHIESIECRLDELELENEKMLKDQELFEQDKSETECLLKERIEELEV